MSNHTEDSRADRSDSERDSPHLAAPSLLANAQGLILARDEERRGAPLLLEQLEGLTESQALRALESDPRFGTWGLAELLIERCRRSIFAAEPAKAVHFARLATLVSERADTAIYGQALVADFTTQAWGALANAYRVSSRFPEARQAFSEAEQRLLCGTGDPLEGANLLSLMASLHMDLGEYELAVDVLDEAIAIYRDVDDQPLLGRTLLQKAIAVGIQEPERGLLVLAESIRYLDYEVDPRTFLFARHEQIHLLLDSGRAIEADRLLESSRYLYARVGGDWLALRMAWVEAKLCCSLGRLDEADAGFNVILTEVLERGLHLDSALAALDLAACRILQGRSREAHELALSMAGMFEAWGVHRRALEAWSIVQHALATETATVTLLRDVAGYLSRAWRNPEIPFAVSI